ncbi:MAG: hypothetical protein ACYCSF_08125 [Acidimicrobiales bacterium]
MSSVFVDESIRGDYHLCAAVVADGDLGSTRTAMRQLLATGQRRLHFVDESPGRRRVIASRIARLPLRATVYSCATTADKKPRATVMRALVADLPGSALRLVLESRGDRDSEDKQLLIELQKRGELPAHLTYDHLRAWEEPLLWVADAVAWCWGRRECLDILGPVLAAGRRSP